MFQNHPIDYYIRILVVAILVVSGAPTFAAETRSLDGQGNNLAQPDQGAAGTTFIRTTFADYSDGLSQPAGNDRANAREISNTLGSQAAAAVSTRQLSSMTWQWGQFIDHDIALTRTHATETFSVPVTDATDALYPVIPMMRSAYDETTGITNARQQINSNSSYLDASMVYGIDQDRANGLRTFSGGQLKMSAGNLLPYNTDLYDNANDSRIEVDQNLFLAGDRRANEQPGLTSMHTVFAREHNRVASDLAANNQDWSDEQIYQHSRRIVGGIVQSITYHEFLPTIMGSSAPSISSYDPTIDATLSNEFAAAAFRMGHTQVTDKLMRMDQSGNAVADGPVAMNDAFFRPSLISESADVDEFMNGLHYQVQNELDLAIVDDLRNMLFGAPGAGGMDLFALNVQRGRDHGLPGYSDVAAQFGLDRPNSFADLTSIESLQQELATAYDSVDDIDLWVGLLAEDHVAGTEFGLVMNSMLHDEFKRLMEGDRFFFAWDSGLTAAEIQMIQNTGLADVISRNTALSSMSGNVFLSVVAVPEPMSSGLILMGTIGWCIRRRKRG